MMRALCCLVLCAAPAAAEVPAPPRWQAQFDACVAAADAAQDLAQCKGLAARLCMDTTEGGHTTLGMTECNAMETGLWDDLLNADWPAHRAWAEAEDAEDAKFFGDQFSARAASLLAAQRAWIAFRDAECGLDHAIWGSGSMRHIIHSACMSEMTADRVIRLRGLTEGM
ncbi:lysozyme inhibitor LprI family protein [Jannaschia sp. M317]|uniref:lysozyme inhibitor LprI family protein n=1 Tax=Jannaschia sp. M317 TaxID=2867011 RepID=UPI0021A96CF0|nr:lysozyme inhibitor LprI family protein [Jannaschia sp. M317]UWQ17831.1 DUF1311 domain-containing protein [Jannaschia sp. M317]